MVYSLNERVLFSKIVILSSLFDTVEKNARNTSLLAKNGGPVIEPPLYLHTHYSFVFNSSGTFMTSSSFSPFNTFSAAFTASFPINAGC